MGVLYPHSVEPNFNPQDEPSLSTPHLASRYGADIGNTALVTPPEGLNGELRISPRNEDINRLGTPSDHQRNSLPFWMTF